MSNLIETLDKLMQQTQWPTKIESINPNHHKIPLDINYMIAVPMLVDSCNVQSATTKCPQQNSLPLVFKDAHFPPCVDAVRGIAFSYEAAVRATNGLDQFRRTFEFVLNCMVNAIIEDLPMKPGEHTFGPTYLTIERSYPDNKTGYFYEIPNMAGVELRFVSQFATGSKEINDLYSNFKYRV